VRHRVLLPLYVVVLSYVLPQVVIYLAVLQNCGKLRSLRVRRVAGAAGGPPAHHAPGKAAIWRHPPSGDVVGRGTARRREGRQTALEGPDAAHYRGTLCQAELPAPETAVLGMSSALCTHTKVA
jgi:hypothetical protein